MINTLLIIAAVIVSFVGGILVGRKNANKVSSAIAEAKVVSADVKKL